MAQEILIDVAPNGEVQITTKGFKGRSCKEATAELEKALGAVVTDVDTPEMHLREAARVSARG
jgi:hypothetical protein